MPSANPSAHEHVKDPGGTEVRPKTSTSICSKDRLRPAGVHWIRPAAEPSVPKAVSPYQRPEDSFIKCGSHDPAQPEFFRFFGALGPPWGVRGPFSDPNKIIMTSWGAQMTFF